MWRTFAVCGLSFVALIAVFIGLLVSMLLFVDDARIIVNLKKSIDEKALTDQDYPTSPFGHGGIDIHTFDMFSECVGLGLNLLNNDEPLAYRIAAAPYIGPKRNGSLAIAGQGAPCADLVQAIQSGNAKSTLPYFRFWHGYQVYLRPMLSVLTLTGIHRANAMLLYGSLLLLTYRLSRWLGPWTFAAFLIPFATVTDLLTVPLVTVHALSLAWTFLSVAIILFFIERRGEAGIAVLTVVFCSGAISNFVSFLFNPPLAPALIAFLIIGRSSTSAGTSMGHWHKVGRAGFAVGLWFSGFALAWIAKWVIAGFVLGFSVVAGDLTVAGSGSGYNAYMTPDIGHIFYPTRIVVRFGGIKIVTAASYAVAGIVLARLAISRRLQMSQIADFLTLQGPLIVPVIWVELMRYHSVEHAGFVVRSFSIFVIFPLLATLAVTRKSSAQEPT